MMEMDNRVKIDHEYNCVWIEEHRYLQKLGLRYVFVKTIGGITVYKYKKTPILFKYLMNFYDGIDLEKQ